MQARRPVRVRASLALPLVLALALATNACTGVAALLYDDYDDEKDDEDPDVIRFFAVTGTETQPALISFVLETDAVPEPADPTAPYSVEIQFRMRVPQPDGSFKEAPLTGLFTGGAIPNPATFSFAADAGFNINWPFNNEPLLPDDNSLFKDVTVFAKVIGYIEAPVIGVNAAVVSLGFPTVGSPAPDEPPSALVVRAEPGPRDAPAPDVHVEVLTSDPEGADLVTLVQWAERGGPFAPAPATADELGAALSLPDAAERLGLARPGPLAHGRGARALASALDELEGESHAALALELLRWGGLPRALGLARPSPIDVLPLDGGLALLVLEAPAPDAWRLVALDVAHPSDARVLASGAGARPLALVPDPGSPAALVAESVPGGWRLVRVPLDAPGAAVVAFDSRQHGLPPDLRDLAARPGGPLLALAGADVLAFDATLAAPRAFPSSLPLGAAPDALAVGTDGAALVARDGWVERVEPEGDVGRLFALRGVRALARDGERIVALADDADARALWTWTPGDAGPARLGAVPADARAPRTGADDALAFALPGAGDVALAGGLAARLPLAAAGRLVAADGPLGAWRIVARPALLPAPPGTQRSRWLVPAGDSLRVRAVPYDAARGAAGERAVAPAETSQGK